MFTVNNKMNSTDVTLGYEEQIDINIFHTHDEHSIYSDFKITCWGGEVVGFKVNSQQKQNELNFCKPGMKSKIISIVSIYIL